MSTSTIYLTKSCFTSEDIYKTYTSYTNIISTLTTALFGYISAGRSTHCAFYHWRPHLSSDCCISLEQSAGVGPVVSVVASFLQQTQNRTFCLVLVMTNNVSLHWLLLRDFTV